MPVCYVTLSEKVPELSADSILYIRKAVATGLDSKSRKLDETHIALRLQRGVSSQMLGDIELDVYAQLYWRRFFSRDKRANKISELITDHLGLCCATWINLCMVGYSRVDKEQSYFSDSDNKAIRLIQKAKGVSTGKRKDVNL